MRRHRFYGDPNRFQIVADYIADRYALSVKYTADVAGGQGMLTRILSKKYNYAGEVIDPRGWVLKGVKNRPEKFDPTMASYYDLIVGLHPDGALREVAQSALIRPVILIPCCNFWSSEKLSQEELLQAIESYYQSHAVSFERMELKFKGPKNTGLVSEPP